MSRAKRTSIAVACGCALALPAGTMPSSLAATRTVRLGTVRLGTVPRLPSGSRIIGQLPGQTILHLDVVLRPSDPTALARFATAVSTPGSSLYGHYISASQFARRFGAGSAQIAAVERSLQAHGLTPGPVSTNRLSIPVTATASQLGAAFSLSLLRIRLPSRANAITNDAAPSLDANIAGLVQGVVGLNTLSAPQPLTRRSTIRRPVSSTTHSTRHLATGGPQPCAAASQAAPSQSAYTTDQVASAYGFSGLYRAGDFGQGGTVAVYELEPYSASDIAAYQACYGTHASVFNVYVDGGAGSGPGSGEAALDIEQVVGLAPRANVLVYEGPNSNSGAPGAGPYDTWRAIITQDRARVISASWGQCEALEGQTDAREEATLFEEAAAQGQTIVSASGDSGSEDCFNQEMLPNTALAVDDPSSQPFVTGVGGTTLRALGPRPSEVVWNDGGNPLGGLLGLEPGAGGGGESSFWGMPTYQADAPSSLHVRQSAARESPDVSADADPNTGYLIYWNGAGAAQGPSGWQGIGGTSGAAPVWAALFALADSSPACGSRRIGFANPALYRAAGTAYEQDLNDITAGDNDFTGTHGGRYSAGPGYDMASGLGSPNATALVASLCRHPARAGAPRVSNVTLSGVRRDRPVLGLTVSAGANAPAIEAIAIRLPSGLRFRRARGRLTVIGPRGGRVAFRSVLRRGVLRIRLDHAKSRVRITIRYAKLTATRHESAAAGRGRVGKLRIVVAVTDARGHATRLSATVKPRS